MKKEKARLGIIKFFKVERSLPNWWFIFVIYFLVLLSVLLLVPLVAWLVSCFTPMDFREIMISTNILPRPLVEWPLYLLGFPGALIFFFGFGCFASSIKDLWRRRGYIKYSYPGFKKLCDAINARADFRINSKDFYTWITRNNGNMYDISKIMNCSTLEYMSVSEMIEKIRQIFGIHNYHFEYENSIEIVKCDRCDNIALQYVLYAYVKEHQLDYERIDKHGVLYDRDKTRIYYDKKIGFFYM